MRARVLLGILVGLTLATSLAANIPDPMQPPRLVNDFAKLLKPEEWKQLEGKLRSYHDTTTTQIYVVTVTSLEGYAISDFAFRLGEKWGVGQQGKNNGVVMVIKPRTQEGAGEVFIATGYGLEDVIPDATAKRIVERELIPHFKEGNIYGGIDAATNTIINLASGKFTAEQYNEISYAPFIFLAIVFLIIFFAIGKAASKSKGHSLGHNIPFWIALGMLSGGGGRSGGFGSFSSGSGGFGGFSGGGGGSFGGGGAGGRW